MLKLYNNGLIGYCETGRSEFGLYGQDTESVYNKNLNLQSNDWKYRRQKVFYDRNSVGHRSVEHTELDKEFILFLGCSITVGSSVALEETFPFIVSRSMDIDYYNLAVEGAGYDLVCYNLNKWFEIVKKKPKSVIIKWPQPFRTFRINENKVIPLGPWSCKSDIGNGITKEQWSNFEAMCQTDYFLHYNNIIRSNVKSFLEVQDIKLIEVPDIEPVDFGRDLKHPGSDTHLLFSSSILKSFGQ